MAKSAQTSADVLTFRKIVRENLGGPHYYTSLLGFRTFEIPDLLDQVEAGFSYKTFERFQRNIHFQSDELAALVKITPRTLVRRRKAGHLTAEESDRLLRFSRVFGRALALFDGDVDAARTWFSLPAPALANRTPQDVSSTEVGAHEVENLIGRLEHGVFS